MITLEPASDRVPPGLEAMLLALGTGEAGFGGTTFGRGEQTLADFLAERVRQQLLDPPPEGRVPQTTFWILLHGDVAGMLKMRHYLNDALRTKGGHIGYYVAPWARLRGVASAALGLALKELAGLGETRALLTTNPDKPGSIRVIERHGGRLAALRPDPDGGLLCQYWIDLTRPGSRISTGAS